MVVRTTRFPRFIPSETGWTWSFSCEADGMDELSKVVVEKEREFLSTLGKGLAMGRCECALDITQERTFKASFLWRQAEGVSLV